MRYLGIYFVQSIKLKCSLDAAKRGFYRAANSNIFSKIGRTASEEVILQIISSKCMPILMYRLETLPLQKNHLNSQAITYDFYPAMRMHSADYAVAICLSVRPSVTRTPVLCLNDYKFSSPSDCPAILLFPYQTRRQYSDGNPLNGVVDCKGV